MQQLGEAFSDGDHREMLTRHFETGKVLYLNWELSRGERDKYSLLICPDPPPLFLLFNTGIAKFIEANPRLKACQVKVLSETDPDAVRDDCYLDCTEVKSKAFEQVLNQIKKDPARILGKLCRETLLEVFLALQRDKRIPLGQKVRLLNAIRPLVNDPPTKRSAE